MSEQEAVVGRRTCFKCNGRGRLAMDGPDCSVCGGTGSILEDDPVVVGRVPDTSPPLLSDSPNLEGAVAWNRLTTGWIGANCVLCGQRVPPYSTHECSSTESSLAKLRSAAALAGSGRDEK